MDLISVRHQRQYEMDTLQADIRRRRQEVEELRLESLRQDGLPSNINAIWQRFHEINSGNRNKPELSVTEEGRETFRFN